jgi:hypothetical protein
MASPPFDVPPGWVEHRAGRRVFPDLSPDLAGQLRHVKPSRDQGILYRPCEVVLADGTVCDRVYIQDAASLIAVSGVWPEENVIDVVQVREVRESPSRLPASFASKIYGAGESSMGGTIFELEFGDGIRQVYKSGRLIDFLQYPEGLTSADVVRAFPHRGREAQTWLTSRDYFWCLYGAGESQVRVWRWETS